MGLYDDNVSDMFLFKILSTNKYTVEIYKKRHRKFMGKSNVAKGSKIRKFNALPLSKTIKKLQIGTHF
jgi:ribosomal protein L31